MLVLDDRRGARIAAGDFVLDRKYAGSVLHEQTAKGVGELFPPDGVVNGCVEGSKYVESLLHSKRMITINTVE